MTETLLNKLAIYLLPLYLTLSPISLVAQADAYNALNIENAVKYIHENPNKAIKIGEGIVEVAKTSNDKITIIKAYAIVSRAYTLLGSDQLSKLYLDSAEATSLNLLPTQIIAELERARIAQLAKEEDNKKAIAHLESIIKTAKKRSDTYSQVELNLMLSDLYRQFASFDEALTSAKSALKLTELTPDKLLLAKSYRTIGSLYFQQSLFNQAQEFYNSAKVIFEDISDTLGILTIIRNISLIDREKGLFDEAQINLLNALQIANKFEAHDEMGIIYNLLGSLNARTGKLTEALEFYKQSLEIRKQLDLLSSVASTLENISRVQKDLNQFDKALSNLNRSLSIRKELNEPRQLSSTFNEMGNLYAQQGNLAEALKHYLNSLKIRQEANLQSDIARSLTNIGITFRRLGSHQNAQKYFSEALEIISDKTDPIGKAYVLINLGNTQRDLGKTHEAINSYSKALELRKRTGNKLSIMQTLRSLAVSYGDLSDFREANKLLDQAYRIAYDLDDGQAQADIYNEQGNIAQKEGNLDAALLRFESAAILFGQSFELEKRGLCIRKIGEIQTKLGNYTYAYQNLQLALSIAKKTGNAKLKELAYLALYDFYLAKGQYKEALQFFNWHIETRDSLAAITQKEAVWQASLDLELDKKVTEIKLIEGEVETLRAEAKLKTIQIKQQKLIRNFLATISLLILIFGMGSIYGYLVIRKKNLKLNETNEKLALSEGDLRKIVQTKDKLFSIIAHDLRSPFTALVGFTELLSNQASALNFKEVTEYSALIHKSSEKLLTLIENLLNWSRSQTGKISLLPREIPLRDLVSDLVSITELSAKAKEIKIENSIPADLNLTADYDTLTTVIRNLISNAIKYTNFGGKVMLSANTQEDNVEILITDNGVGISKENLKRLFKIEHSFSTKGTSSEEGTGLGLIVCKEFVEKNGGNISIASELGNGTTFTITLPLNSMHS